MNKTIFHFSLLLCVLSLNNCHAQGQYKNWYFGINSGVTFTDTGLRVIKDSKSYTVEGSASISDSAGNLLFYIGKHVLDRNNNRMPNDTGYIYDGTTQQSFLIVPKPGNPDIYYYLLNSTNTIWGGQRTIRVQVIDMKQNNGNGDIISKNDTLFTNSTEQLTATRHRNGKDIWIVTHSFATNEFYSFLVTDKGINRTPVISATGISPNNIVYAYTGTMKISQNGCWLASTIREAYKGSGALQLLHFDNSTGKVTGNGYKKVVAPYGIEFSPNSRRLYMGTNGMGPIVQFDLDGKTDSSILSNGIDCSDTIFCTFDFQLGPDNKIYFPSVELDWLTKRSANDPYLHHLGIISFPDRLGKACQAKTDTLHSYDNVKCSLPNNFNLNSTTYKSCKLCSTLTTTTLSQTICSGDSIKFGSGHLRTSGVYYGDTVKNMQQCDSTTLLYLTVRKSANISHYHSICKGDSFRFFDSTITAAGTYRHRSQTYQGCDSIVSMVVSVNPLPEIPAIRDTVLCRQTLLNSDLSKYGFRQLSLNGLPVSPVFSTNQTHNILRYTDSNLCSGHDSFEIIFKDCDSNFLIIGNVFTPGNDGLNDDFDIAIYGETQYDLFVYNRWGILVFEQHKDAETNTGENWNGRLFNKGATCSDGTYYYIFEYSFKEKQIRRVNGTVQLIR